MNLLFPDAIPPHRDRTRAQIRHGRFEVLGAPRAESAIGNTSVEISGCRRGPQGRLQPQSTDRRH